MTVGPPEGWNLAESSPAFKNAVRRQLDATPGTRLAQSRHAGCCCALAPPVVAFRRLHRRPLRSDPLFSTLLSTPATRPTADGDTDERQPNLVREYGSTEWRLNKGFQATLASPGQSAPEGSSPPVGDRVKKLLRLSGLNRILSSSAQGR